MSTSDKEDEYLPSVDSQNMEERIAARRFRIQHRIDAQRKAELGITDDVDTKVVELTKSRHQMEMSRVRITKLIRDGNEFITNIRVAGDARENSRRIEEDEMRRQRREKLEAEAKAADEKFDDITKKWETALQKEIPQDLHEMLQLQKDGCYSLIEEKNKLINELKFELKSKDDLYVKELKKQAEEIDLLVERMEEQVKTMTKSYRQELLQIEKSFVSQREETRDRQNQQWEDLMQQIRDEQEKYLDTRKERVDHFETQLQLLRVQHAEEYNELKINLEKDVERLQQQVQLMKATFQLNLEKLEYNFQVLKKRDEENTITKSQQKRKITRLQDVLNNLKIRLQKQEKEFRQQNDQLTEDYRRVTEQFRDLMKKAKTLLGVDTKKFHDIWLMNEEECKMLAERLMNADRVIHEQQLNISWQQPSANFLENVGPVVSKADKAKSVPVTQAIHEVLSREDSSKPGLESIADVDDIRGKGVEDLNSTVIKSILELICDEAGFLIEKKLKTLLAPLDSDEQSLMQLDAVFAALGISSPKEIDKILPYFIEPATVQDTESAHSSEGGSSDEEIREIVSEGKKVVLIHPNRILKALRAFVDELHRDRTSAQMGQFTLTDLEDRDESEDTEYWASYPGLISEDKGAAWDALLEGLEKYSGVLQSRATLLSETDALRVQNAELRHLLQQYVTSKVNQELQIPPTKVMQLDRMN